MGEHAPSTIDSHSVGVYATSPVYTHSLGKYATDTQSAWEFAPSTLYTQSVGVHTTDTDHVTTDNENAFKDDDQTKGTSFFYFTDAI